MQNLSLRKPVKPNATEKEAFSLFCRKSKALSCLIEKK